MFLTHLMQFVNDHFNGIPIFKLFMQTFDLQNAIIIVTQIKNSLYILKFLL